MNNNGYVFVAAVIARNDWTSDICLVGHENTVEVACYNPHIFLREPSGEVVSSNMCSVVALGADDLALSVWQTKSPRPLVVAKEAFKRQIYDLSWSFDGLTLYACSADGTIAVMDFDKEELDGIVPVEGKDAYLKGFGFEPPTHSAPIPQRRAIPLTYHQPPIHQPPPPAPVLDPGPAFDSKGRRRIMPKFVSHLSSTGVPGVGTAVSAPTTSYNHPANVPLQPQQSWQASPVNGSSSGLLSNQGRDPPPAFGSQSNTLAVKRKADEMEVELIDRSTFMRSTSGRTLGGGLHREPAPPVRDLADYPGNFTVSDRPRRILQSPPIKSYLVSRSQEIGHDVFEARNYDVTSE